MVNRVGKIRRYFDNISSYTIGRVAFLVTVARVFLEFFEFLEFLARNDFEFVSSNLIYT